MVIVVILSVHHEAEVTKVPKPPRYARRIGTLDGVPVYYSHDSRDNKVSRPYLASMAAIARYMFVEGIPQRMWSRGEEERKVKTDESHKYMERMF